MNMNHRMMAGCAAILVALASDLVLAGEGHDHGDAPPPAAGKALPSVTAVTESFELVGRLHADELSILIDRADTTEPVLDAELSVELNGRSALAPFHADHGDYSLTDPEILARLRQPGSKSLLFTLVAGRDSDLLAGELDVHDEPVAADPGRPVWQGYALAGVAVAGLLAVFAVAARRLRAARQSSTGGVA